MPRHPAIIVMLSAVMAAALAFVACGGSGNDEQQIRDLVDDTFTALEDLDGAKFARLMSKECNVDEKELEAGFALLKALSGDEFEIKVDIDDVKIENLTDDRADVIVYGKATFAGETQTFGEDGGPTAAVKEDGEWRWGDCEAFDTAGDATEE